MGKIKPTDHDEVEELWETLVRTGVGFDNDTDDVHEQEINAMLVTIKNKASEGTPSAKVQSFMLREALKTSVIRMVYAAHNTDGKNLDPQWVPLKYIQHALQYPAVDTMRPYVNRDQRKSIDGPTRAIRVKCFECQGSDTDAATAVRECASINCFLWPFRMGMNPFFGRLRDSDGEEEANESDDEIDALELLRAPDAGVVVTGED